MPKRTPAKDPNAEILAVLAKHPEGLSRVDLQVGVGQAKEEPFRFRRVLKALEVKRQIRGEGITRARRYFRGLPGVTCCRFAESSWVPSNSSRHTSL